MDRAQEPLAIRVGGGWSSPRAILARWAPSGALGSFCAAEPPCAAWAGSFSATLLLRGCEVGGGGGAASARGDLGGEAGFSETGGGGRCPPSLAALAALALSISLTMS